MPKIPAALMIFVAATLTTGCASTSTVKKTNTMTVAKQACTLVNIATKPLPPPESSTAQRVQTGRYSMVKSEPTNEQSNLLDVMITVTIPYDIQTIGETVKYLLRRSGYQMMSEAIQGQEVSKFLSRPLPYTHRKIGPMKLVDALNMLTSPAFVLVDNPVKREVGYRLKSKYQPGVT